MRNAIRCRGVPQVAPHPPRAAGRERAGAGRRRRNRCRGRNRGGGSRRGGRRGGAPRRSRGGGRGAYRRRLRARRGRGRHGRGHRERRGGGALNLPPRPAHAKKRREGAIFLLPPRRAVPNFATRVRGAIAQLGERYNGIVEVTGSIPVGSTNKNKGLASSAKPLRILGNRTAEIWENGGSTAPTRLDTEQAI